MDEMMIGTPTYPMLERVVRYGDWASGGVAVLVALAALAWAYCIGSVIVAVAGVAFALGIFIMGRILVDLVRLITDMLLPR